MRSRVVAAVHCFSASAASGAARCRDPARGGSEGGLEQPWHGRAAQVPGWDIAIAPGAHLSGALNGTGCALAAAFWRRRSGPLRHAGGPSMVERKPRLDGLALVALLACCAGLGPGPGRQQDHAGRSATAAASCRALIGAAVLVALWARWRGIRLVARDGTVGAGLAAGLLFAIEFACIFTGLKFTTASRMVVFVYLAPFVVALGMPLDRPRRAARRRAGPRPGGGVCQRHVGICRRLPAALGRRAAMAWRCARGRGGAVLGRDHAADPCDKPVARGAREDTVLSVGRLSASRWRLHPGLAEKRGRSD